MPRPDSKIMQTAVNSGGSDTAAPVTDVTPKATRAPKAAKVVAPPPTKAELKQKKLDLAAALKLAREPLTKVEADLKALDKADADAAKAHTKLVDDIERNKAKVLLARGKAQVVSDKARASLGAKKAKFEVAFAKTQAKIDAQIAAL